MLEQTPKEKEYFLVYLSRNIIDILSSTIYTRSQTYIDSTTTRTITIIIIITSSTNTTSITITTSSSTTHHI